jgi:hypothetical protein
MPLPKVTRTEVLSYAAAHIPDEAWHVHFFDFVSDPRLRGQLGKEYWAARCVYKMLEGVQASGSLLRTQVKVQVLQYASLYEAVLHYLLFTKYADAPAVQVLTQTTHRVNVAISQDLRARLVKQTKVPVGELVVMRATPTDADITKIRFDVKAATATSLGLVSISLRDDLVEVFSARNAIHLHAEIKKNLNYQLDLSRKAYRRMKPLKNQVVARLTADGRL